MVARVVAEGAKVAMNDRDKASLDKVAKRRRPTQVMVQIADVSDPPASMDWSRLSSAASGG
ncbi:hypothetical protein AB4Z51_24325 [Bradyrhizobium sp. 2TAF36]|uniref:hypothetical protein n=1 Tax=Bradyrhizobium sp. 2TAF36 TaxID=3233016 RepID=UPI003F90620A